MAAADFLKTHIKECKAIIEALLKQKPVFNSLEFIEKFRAKFQREYISWLGSAPDENDAQFQTVHSLIARFLSDYDTVLGIEKGGREEVVSIFGNRTKVQVWQSSKK